MSVRSYPKFDYGSKTVDGTVSVISAKVQSVTPAFLGGDVGEGCIVRYADGTNIAVAASANKVQSEIQQDRSQGAPESPQEPATAAEDAEEPSAAPDGGGMFGRKPSLPRRRGIDQGDSIE